MLCSKFNGKLDQKMVLVLSIKLDSVNSIFLHSSLNSIMMYFHRDKHKGAKTRHVLLADYNPMVLFQITDNGTWRVFAPTKVSAKILHFQTMGCCCHAIVSK